MAKLLRAAVLLEEAVRLGNRVVVRLGKTGEALPAVRPPPIQLNGVQRPQLSGVNS